MSGALSWSGRGPILDAAEESDASYLATHTLLERDGSQWNVIASRVRDRQGAVAALGGGPVASRMVAPDSTMFPVPATLDPCAALLLPVVIQVLRAIEAIPDLGWVAVVSGGGIRCDVLLTLLPWCGVRRTVRVTRDGEIVGTSAADQTVRGDGLDGAEELRGLLRSTSGPVVAFEVRGDPKAQLALLHALPERSYLVLLEFTQRDDRAAIDFYQSLHKKNATVRGVPRVDPQDTGRRERALRLLRERISAHWGPSPTVVRARSGLEPSEATGDLLLLAWPDD